MHQRGVEGGGMDPERAGEPCKETTWASIRASELRILENSVVHTAWVTSRVQNSVMWQKMARE